MPLEVRPHVLPEAYRSPILMFFLPIREVPPAEMLGYPAWVSPISR